jgi:hypothetical protein
MHEADHVGSGIDRGIEDRFGLDAADLDGEGITHAF